MHKQLSRQKTNDIWKSPKSARIDRGEIGGLRHAVGYARVSTQSQAEEGVSLDAQRAAIERYCRLQDIELVAFHTDAGVSGRKRNNRPELASALDAACRAKGVLVVYSLSRLARSLKDTIAIAERLDRAGSELALLAEQIDTTSAAGRMFFHMVAALAQFESDITAERTRLALQYKRAAGERHCKDAPYGFRFHRGWIEECRNEQLVLKRMRGLRSKGLSYRQIAQTLDRSGLRNRAGSPFQFQQVARLLTRE